MARGSAKPTRTRRPSCMGFLMDVLINSALIGLGVVLFIHFMIYPLAPVGLSPVLMRLVGSEKLAIYLISGIPFVIGSLAMCQAIFRFVRRIFAR